ncbi:MAG: hypothetical protein GF330_10740 [Candidatus Eisenbacteria bacterium]|nr:hypothetical protein [Candidatus Eisenbacteria bacterium]
MRNDEDPGREPREGEEVEWLDLHPVFDAPDEATAIHVRALLRGGGIEARIRSKQIPGFDGAYAMALGYWGQVMVPRREVIRAKALLEPLLREIERAQQDESGEEETE